MPNLKADSYGTYTDSVEYSEIVPECTNISVGYFDQHTTKESQDLQFAEILLEKLIEAQWDMLAISRDPTQVDRFYDDSWGPYVSTDDSREVAGLEKLLMDRPSEMAGLLFEYGMTLDALCDELQLDYSDRTFYLDVPSYKNY
jgi:hypothetical protein